MMISRRHNNGFTMIEILVVLIVVGLLAALAVSGQPSDRFLFEGFVPSKGAARENALRRLAGLDVTRVIFEAPHLSLIHLCRCRRAS